MHSKLERIFDFFMGGLEEMERKGKEFFKVVVKKEEVKKDACKKG